MNIQNTRITKLCTSPYISQKVLLKVESPIVNSPYFVELNSILYPFPFRVFALKRFTEPRQSQAKPDGVPLGGRGGDDSSSW